MGIHLDIEVHYTKISYFVKFRVLTSDFYPDIGENKFRYYGKCYLGPLIVGSRPDNLIIAVNYSNSWFVSTDIGERKCRNLPQFRCMLFGTSDHGFPS